ncbi:hypothetical protein FACS1894217_12080 [Clostridia bacterium]|nr:hypothetical protein FACS1894217_12080 [Clostridia bacterium]
MLNYLGGEIYRVLHKKSMYIYFGSFAVLFFLFAAFGSKHNIENLRGTAENFFSLLPPVVGGYLFGALYTDDLSSKNLTTLVGFGISKLKIVLSKCILMTLFSAFVFGLIPLFVVGCFAVFGVVPDAETFKVVYIHALTQLLTVVAFAALSGIVVYGVQRNTFAIVLYIVLAFGVISNLMMLLLNADIVRGFAPDLDKYLMSGVGIASRIEAGLLKGESVLGVFAEYAVYVAAALGLSVFAFRGKELEF